MAQFNYEDYDFSSDGQDYERPQRQEDDQLYQDSLAMEFDQLSDDESLNDKPDVDEYASFATDYERHQYDQLQWGGISNLRKYPIAKKNSKESQKARTKKENESLRGTKPEAQDKVRALPKLKKESKTKEEAPGEAVETPKEGEIHFDNRGALWYTYKHNDIYLTGKYIEDSVFSMIC